MAQVTIPRLEDINRNFQTLRDVSVGYEKANRGVFSLISKQVLNLDSAILDLAKGARTRELELEQGRINIGDARRAANLKENQLEEQFGLFQKQTLDKFAFDTSKSLLDYEQLVGKIDYQQKIDDIRKGIGLDILGLNKDLLDNQQAQRLADLNARLYSARDSVNTAVRQSQLQGQQTGVNAELTGIARTKNLIARNFNQVQRDIITQKTTAKQLAQSGAKQFLGFGARSVLTDGDASFSDFLEKTEALVNTFKQEALLDQEAAEIEARARGRDLDLESKGRAQANRIRTQSRQAGNIAKLKDLTGKATDLRKKTIDLKQKQLKDIHAENKLFRDQFKKHSQNLFLLSQNFRETQLMNTLAGAGLNKSQALETQNFKLQNAERDFSRFSKLKREEIEQLRFAAEEVYRLRQKYEELANAGA